METSCSLIIFGFILGPMAWSGISTGINALIQNGFAADPNNIFPLIPAALIILFASISLIGILQSYLGTKRLHETFQKLSGMYGLLPADDKSAHPDYPPELSVFTGKFGGRQLTVYPTSDPSRRNNNRALKVTVFYTPVNPDFPSFKLQKTGAFGSFMQKMVGGTIFREKFLLYPEKSAGVDASAQITTISSRLGDEILYEFENLPGQNRIIVKNGIFTLMRDGFMYNADDYMPYFNFLSKLKT